MVLGLFVSVWIARALGPDAFGTLNWMLALVGLLSALTSLGLNELVVRELVRTPEDAPEILGSALALQLLGGSLGFGLLLVLVSQLRPADGESMALAVVLGVQLLALSADVVRYQFEARLENRYLIWAGWLVFAAITAGRVALLLAGAPMIAFAVMIGLEFILMAVTAFVLAVWRNRGTGRWRARGARALSLLKESWPMLFAGIAVLINLRVDQIMLGDMRGDGEVGIYSAAVRVSELWYFLPVVIAGSAYPALVALHGRDAAAEAARWARLYAAMLWLAVAAGVVASLTAGWGVRLLFGAPYAAAGPVLALHIWAGIPVCLGLVWSKWMLLHNKQRLTLAMQLGGAALNVGLNLWLIPEFGAMGAALATLGSYFIGMIFGFLLFRPSQTFGYLSLALRPWRLAAS